MSPIHHNLRRAFVAALVTLVVSVVPVLAQWEKVNIPPPYNNEYYLDIMFLPGNSNYGWACSQDGAVIRTVDGGVTWTGVKIPWFGQFPPAPFLESIMFLTPLVGYVSGPGGIYRSTTGGATWIDITPAQMDPEQEKGWGCYFLNEQEGVYMVDGCGGLQKFFRTTNAGASWSRYVTQLDSSGLSDAIIYRNGSGYASSSGAIWETKDFGASWDLFVRTGPKYWTEEITNINTTFLLPTAGSDCNGTFGNVGSIRWTSNNGVAWREFQTGNAMFGSFLLDETHGWAVGINRSVYYSSDAGRNWQLRNCGIQGDPDDVFFVDANNGWVAGLGLYRSIFDRQPQIVSLDPPDRTISICDGETFSVGGSAGLIDYVWSDSTVGQMRVLSKQGEYILAATDPITCHVSYDTINVIVYPNTTPEILATKAEVCFGDSVELRADGPYTSWSWSTGATSQNITVSKSDTYIVTTVDTNGCMRVSAPHAVTIRPPVEPVITNIRPLTFCIDDSVTLVAPSGYKQYQWSSGEQSKSIVVKTSGTYTVTVVDEAGCLGTAPPVTVTVLNIRNQVEVQMTPGSDDLIVPEHIVGQQRCATITIVNRSDSSVLSLRNPHLLGNVLCSLPLSQLPVVIGPLGSLTLTICCAAIDSGLVHDTLELPDTCSSTFIPVRSRGLVNILGGDSRCNVPVGTVIFRAGAPYRLSNPYPVPATSTIAMQVRSEQADMQVRSELAPTAQVVRPAVASAYVVNTVGQIVAPATLISSMEGSESVTDIEADVSGLTPGVYSIALVLSDGQILRHEPFVKAAP